MSDVFRKEYRELSNDKLVEVARIKDAASVLYELISTNPAVTVEASKARALEHARAKLEESVMWAVKGITG